MALKQSLQVLGCISLILHIRIKTERRSPILLQPSIQKPLWKQLKASGLSAYYLASKIVQEVGGSKPTADGANGQ